MKHLAAAILALIAVSAWAHSGGTDYTGAITTAGSGSTTATNGPALTQPTPPQWWGFLLPENRTLCRFFYVLKI